MRWDIREPDNIFADRYVLVARHCNPVVYAILTVMNEALRIKFRETGYLLNIKIEIISDFFGNIY